MKTYFAVFTPLSTGGMKRRTRWSTDKNRVCGAAADSGFRIVGTLVSIISEKKPKAVHMLPDHPPQFDLSHL